MMRERWEKAAWACGSWMVSAEGDVRTMNDTEGMVWMRWDSSLGEWERKLEWEWKTGRGRWTWRIRKEAWIINQIRRGHIQQQRDDEAERLRKAREQ